MRVSRARIADEATAVIPRAENPQPLPTALSALAAAVITGVLYLAAYAPVAVFAVAALAVQLGLVAVYCLVIRPPNLIGVAVVPALAAVATTGILTFGDELSLAPVGPVIALAFLATVIAQLARRDSRRQLTEAFGATMMLVVAVSGIAATIPLHRQIGGPKLLAACVAAAGAGLVVARLTDLAVPRPTINYSVPRGVVGVLAGAAAGALVAAVSPPLTDPLTLPVAALAGAGIALAGILADVGTSFAAAGRALIDPPAERSPLRPLLGPLLGVAFAAPAGYVFGLLVLGLLIFT
jgi:hypothetical protein